MTANLQIERQDLTEISGMKSRITNQMKIGSKRDEKVVYRTIGDYQRHENERQDSNKVTTRDFKISEVEALWNKT